MGYSKQEEIVSEIINNYSQSKLKATIQLPHRWVSMIYSHYKLRVIIVKGRPFKLISNTIDINANSGGDNFTYNLSYEII